LEKKKSMGGNGRRGEKKTAEKGGIGRFDDTPWLAGERQTISLNKSLWVGVANEGN